MEGDDPTARIIIFALLVLTDVFFYGFGEAITALNGKEIGKRAQEGDAKATRLEKLISRPAAYVNALQLAVTLAHMAAGAFYLPLLQEAIRSEAGRIAESLWGSEATAGLPIWQISAVLAGALLLYAFLVFGILLPKRIAARLPEKWAYFFITPFYAIICILTPFTAAVAGTVNLILGLLGLGSQSDENDVTEEEIINMVQEGHEQGILQESEARMISNIFELGDKEAQDIMTHRSAVVAIEGGLCLRDAVALMLEEKYSRYPVYEENIDHIIGIIHLKDAMRFGNDRARLDIPLKDQTGLLREPVFVPRTRDINTLFKQMQSGKLQMVVVIDEYGQTDGLVAMEDILEEIVGNIQDEYDEDTDYIEKKGQDRYMIEGKTPLEELEALLDISFDEEEFETINGYMISRLDHIPSEGEKFSVEVGGYLFSILKVENKMVQSVLVEKVKK